MYPKKAWVTKEPHNLVADHCGMVARVSGHWSTAIFLSGLFQTVPTNLQVYTHSTSITRYWMILENRCTESPMRCCLGEYIHLISGCWAATGDSAMIPIWPGSIWIHSNILCQFVAWFRIQHLINGRIIQDPKIHGATYLVPYVWHCLAIFWDIPLQTQPHSGHNSAA